jgi:GDP-L-fucose synthase
MSNLRVFVAGHCGMVGSAIFRFLKNKNVKIIYKTRKELDLTCQKKVNSFFSKESIDQVYIAAAKVGGIHANFTYPAEFIYENLMIQSNIIHAAFLNGVKKLLFLGSSCVYPKNSLQPIREKNLLNGSLESTNEPYAIAKIAGIKVCESYNRQYGISHGIDYRSVMPTNLYGIGDNYHPKNSHVIPALIYKFYNAKLNKDASVKVWGSGLPKRDFLYAEDLAKACYFVMNLEKRIYDQFVDSFCSHINIGSGFDISIANLANKIKKLVQYKGNIEFDESMPDGTNKKLLDCSIINKLGWKPSVSLDDGLKKVYEDFLYHYVNIKKNIRFSNIL